MRILHLFKWKLKDIHDFLPLIEKQGFNAIQISPMQSGKFEDMCDDWWKLYQPYGFSIGNATGSKEDLISLCKEAEKFNIRVFADVVLNHVANDDYNHLVPNVNVDSNIKATSAFFKESKYVYNWDDRFELTNYCIGLPSLRLDNHKLQDIVISFLNELISCGVSGFRIDAGKHIMLPEDGSDFFTRVFDNLSRKDLFNYAEVIFSPKDIIDTYCKYINVLTDCEGSDKSKLVSYIDSHDLEKEFNITSNMRPEDLIFSYFELCGNYPNTIFYAREFDDTWKSIDVKQANTL